jgi:choline dehydrogenase-like flavoprotein
MSTRTTQLSAGFDSNVAIIGSGFGGSVAAHRFTEKGYSVKVIEKGRRWRPKDFPKTNWNLRKSFWFPKLGLRGIQRLSLLDPLENGHASILADLIQIAFRESTDPGTTRRQFLSPLM